MRERGLKLASAMWVWRQSREVPWDMQELRFGDTAGQALGHGGLFLWRVVSGRRPIGWSPVSIVIEKDLPEGLQSKKRSKGQALESTPTDRRSWEGGGELAPLRQETRPF